MYHDKMDKISVVILIVIILLVFGFLAIIFLVVGATDPITVPPVITPSNGLYMNSCVDIPCKDPYVCDGTSFTCRLPEGFPCDTFFSCTEGLICSGICATGPVGGLNELCPCDDNYTCVQQGGLMPNICKGASGAPCQFSTDCLSNTCNYYSQTDGICAGGFPNSYPCFNHDDCSSKNCNNGFCQPQGTVTGVIGSACACGPVGARCNESQLLICECSSTSNVGVCITADQGLLSGCSILSTCSPGLVCYNETFEDCNESDPGQCTCLFPRNDPNLSSDNNYCITGMRYSTSGERCLNDRLLGCEESRMCAGSNCSGPPVIASFIFTGDNVSSSILFPGANKTEIFPAINFGSNMIFDPHRLLAISRPNSFIDDLYVVDKNMGLVSVVYDTVSRNPVIGSVVLDNVTDMSFNGSSYLVAIGNELFIGDNLTSLMSIGEAYMQSGQTIQITYISISVDDDILISSLTSSNMYDIYVKRSGENYYNIVTAVRGEHNGELLSNIPGPGSFYFDIGQNIAPDRPNVCNPSEEVDPNINYGVICPSYQNIAFVDSYEQTPKVLQYSGDIGGIAMPVDRTGEIDYRVYDYSIYSDPVEGMSNSNIITLSAAYANGQFIGNVVSLSLGGLTTVVPYIVGNKSKCAVSANGYYIISVGSCG